MARPAAVPSDLLATDDLVDEIRARPEALVYFCCNIGDGDAQVLMLPVPRDGAGRKLVIVDAGVERKIPWLLEELAEAQLVPQEPSIALVVATHPHQDHIGGLFELLELHRGRVAEVWDPGYFHVIAAFHHLMAEIERSGELLYAHPTSGFRRWIDDVAITVLSPSVQLRNRFDSYGVEINDSSISLRLEFPVYRWLEDWEAIEQGEPTEAPRSVSLVLGADAQTLSWSYVVVDFPHLKKSETPAAKAIAAAQSDRDFLRAEVLKVSHHGSKHGVNLELVERIRPRATVVSSVGERGRFNFPHTLTQEIIREALNPSTQHGRPHPPDYDLGLFYTADQDDAGAPLGTVALVMDPARCTLWRLGDTSGARPRLANARRWRDRLWGR